MPINPTGLSTTPSYQFNQIQNRINKTEEQLISGQRINNAAVDPAGLQVLIDFQTQMRGNSAAIRNSLDGVSALQIADGGVNQVNDSLQRIRELSILAQNGILNDQDKAALQSEADALLSGIQDTIDQSTFNGQSLLTEDGQLRLQTGPETEDSQNVTTFNLNNEFDNNGLFTLDISDAGALDIIDQSQSFLATVSGEIGANQNRLDSNISRLTETTINEAKAASVIGDTNFAKTTSERASALIQQDVGVALLAQANANRGLVLNLLGS